MGPITVDYTYDELGRLKTETYLDRQVTVYYEYDAAGNRKKVTRSGLNAPLVRISSGASSFEGSKLWFAVWLTRPAETRTTVSYVLEGRGSSSSADYTLDENLSDGLISSDSQGGSLVFEAGQDSAKIVVSLIDDNEDLEPEGTEQLFVKLTGVDGAAEIDPARTEGVGQIYDGDSELVLFSVKDISLAEQDANGVAGQATFRITQSGTSTRDYYLNATTLDGTALAGHDYNAYSKRLEFKAGSSVTQTVTVDLIGDNIYEGNEHFFLNLEIEGAATGAVLAQPSAKAKITDDQDMPLVKVSNGSLREGDSGTRYIDFSVWLDTPISTAVSVGYCTRGIDGDEACSKGRGGDLGVTADANDFYGVSKADNRRITLSSADGAQIQIQIKPDSIEEDGDQTFWLQLYDPQGAVLDHEKHVGLGTIREDDYGDKNIFTVNNPDVEEGSNLSFRVQKLGKLSSYYEVEYEVVGGTATAGTDYSVPSIRKLYFGPGDSYKDIVLSTTQDNTYERTEDVHIKLTGIWTTNSSFLQRTGACYGGRIENKECRVEKVSGRGWITDVGDLPILTQGSPPSVMEGGTLEFEGVQLSKPASFDMTFPWGVTSAGTADGTDIHEDDRSGTITFPKGQITPTNPLNMRTKEDSLAEGTETVQVRISTQEYFGNENDATVLTGSIVNDASKLASASTACHRVLEDSNMVCVVRISEALGGTATVSLVPTTDNPVTANGGFLSFAIVAGAVVEGDAQAGTAAPWEDYDGQVAQVTFQPGETTKVVVIDVIDDQINELDEERVVLDATTAETSLVVREPESGVIEDNDEGPVFSATPVTTEEGNLVFVKIAKRGLSEVPHSLRYETADGTAVAGEDYLPQSGTLVFGPDETEKTITIEGVENSSFERTEDFTVKLSAPSQGAVIETPETSVTVADNDPAPMIGISDALVKEGQSIVFKVLMSKASTLAHQVSFRTIEGLARDGADFESLEGTLAFAPGETEKEITFAGIDDDIKEGDERFQAELFSPTNGATLGDQFGQAIIADNDDASFGPETRLTIPAGSRVIVAMAAGAGGDGRRSGATVPGGKGGRGSFELTATKDFFMRVRVGRKGSDYVPHTAPLADENGGGTSPTSAGEAGQGGGATSIIISKDGLTWYPVAIVGAGGGSGSYDADYGGTGGGLNQSGTGARPGDSRSGLGATPTSFGSGGTYGSEYGGSGGAPGDDASASSPVYSGGRGDSEFGIGGGGAGSCIRAGGGGGGRYGGGGAGCHLGGGGGSGYWDEAAWLSVAGVVPTITENLTGGNSGDGFVVFGAVDSSGQPAFDPFAYVSEEGPAVVISDVDIEEGQAALLTLVKTGQHETPLTVSFMTTDGTATAGADYEAFTGSITFLPEETSKTIQIASFIENVFVPEAEREEFYVDLTTSEADLQLVKNRSVVHIKDSSGVPTFSSDDVRTGEGQSFVFDVRLSQPSSLEHTVHYRTEDDSALMGADYTFVEGDLVFAPGETEKRVVVRSLTDEANEKDETFLLELSSPSNGAAVANAAIGTIAGYGSGSLSDGAANPESDPSSIFAIPAGSRLNVTLAAGAGGDGRRSDGGCCTVPGGYGGKGRFEFTAAKDFFMRLRVGKKGGDYLPHTAPQSDINGGATSWSTYGEAGQGGGATSIIVSQDGINWYPVAIVGAGGGSGSYGSRNSQDAGGDGGGLNQSGANAAYGSGGRGATSTNYGAGGSDGSLKGGNGGVPGGDGSIGSPDPFDVGRGDSEFGIGGGGAASGIRSGGGGGGRFGGGGGPRWYGGGGGSGYWDEAAWLSVAGATPTITENVTGGNNGDGYVVFGAADSSGQPAFIPSNYVPPSQMLPKVSIAATNSSSVIEGGALTFDVTLSQQTSYPVAVSYMFHKGAMVAGVDFIAEDGQLEFLPGETTKQIVVQTIDDETPTGARRLEVEIHQASEGLQYGSYIAEAIIEDNDGPAAIQIVNGTTRFDENTDTTILYKVNAGSSINVTLAAGAGGDGRRSDGGCCTVPGGYGGKGRFEFTAAKDFFMRLRVGKKGGDHLPHTAPQSDINGGATSWSTYGEAGQGGGATSIIVSQDGINWYPVAIVGAGGGSGSYGSRNSQDAGGDGGGLNQSGANAANGSGGRGATPTSSGVGGSYSSLRGGNGGIPAGDGHVGTPDPYAVGRGDSDFGIGGGGAATSIRSGGGGGGRYGGGGGPQWYGGGGGSGYWDEAAWLSVTGATPTITENLTGGNNGDGFVEVVISGGPQ